MLYRHYKQYLFFICISLVITSCEGYKLCPDYDDEVLTTWFPNYVHKGATFYFTDSLGSVDTLSINNVRLSEYYRIPDRKRDLEVTDEQCDISARIASDTSTPRLLNLNISHNTGEQSYSKSYLSFSFKGFKTSFLVEDEKLIVTDAIQGYVTELLKEVDINNKQYDEVIYIHTLASTHASKSGFTKLYIAKGVGIIGYQAYPQLNEYWLQ